MGYKDIKRSIIVAKNIDTINKKTIKSEHNIIFFLT